MRPGDPQNASEDQSPIEQSQIWSFGAAQPTNEVPPQGCIRIATLFLSICGEFEIAPISLNKKHLRPRSLLSFVFRHRSTEIEAGVVPVSVWVGCHKKTKRCLINSCIVTGNMYSKREEIFHTFPRFMARRIVNPNPEKAKELQKKF